MRSTYGLPPGLVLVDRNALTVAHITEHRPAAGLDLKASRFRLVIGVRPVATFLLALVTSGLRSYRATKRAVSPIERLSAVNQFDLEHPTRTPSGGALWGALYPEVEDQPVLEGISKREQLAERAKLHRMLATNCEPTHRHQDGHDLLPAQPSRRVVARGNPYQTCCHRHGGTCRAFARHGSPNLVSNLSGSV